MSPCSPKTETMCRALPLSPTQKPGEPTPLQAGSPTHFPSGWNVGMLEFLQANAQAPGQPVVCGKTRRTARQEFFFFSNAHQASEKKHVTWNDNE